MDDLKPQKQIVIEKAMRFEYLLIILCILVFMNLILISTIEKPITRLDFNFNEVKSNLGIICVFFALYCFLMSIAFPLLYKIAAYPFGCLMYEIKYFLIKNNKKDKDYYKNWHSISLVKMLALKTNNSVLMNYCMLTIYKEEKHRRNAALSFSLLTLSILDFVFSFDSSCLYLIIDFASQFDVIARLIYFITGIFILYLFYYSFSPIDFKVNIKEDVWLKLNEKK